MFTRKKEGFTLVEIMIVVAIIGLLVAIAIPNLLRARLSANEAAAKGSMRTIVTALENYRADQNPPSYPEEFEANLVEDSTPPYLDPQLGAGYKQGFEFFYYPADAVNINIGGGVDVYPGYTVTAAPVSDSTGTAQYMSNETGIIYVDPTGEADLPEEYTATADIADDFTPIGS